MKYSIKNDYVKTISLNFKDISDISKKTGNNVPTLKSFDFYFSVFKDFLETKDINIQKNDSINIELYFITNKPLEDSFIKQLLDKGLFEIFGFKDSEEIIPYLDIVYNKTSLESKLEIKNNNVKSFNKI